MPYRTRRRGPSTASKPRWMDLRYAGTCQVCKTGLPVGARAFYDPRDRTVTCTELPCASAAGITKNVWHGAPGTGSWVEVLSEHRIGSSIDQADDDPFAKTRSRGYHGRDAGRCEDAPCCGCCP